MSTKKRSATAFLMSFIITMLVIILFSALILITHRVESTMNIEPIVVFTLTDHTNGQFSFSFFNLNGKFNIGKFYWVIDEINKFQVLVPIKMKSFLQIISTAIDSGYNMVKGFINV